MPKDIPAFLKDFMAMRQGLHKTVSAPIVSATPASTTGQKTRSAKGTADGTLGDLLEISVAKIIEDKPPKKDVKAYFQKVCDRLTAQKMK
jgi:hypothetical protein